MKRSELKVYPAPQDNPECHCYPLLFRAFFCSTGHMTECHYPITCDVALCSHLAQYGVEFDPEDDSGEVRHG